MIPVVFGSCYDLSGRCRRTIASETASKAWYLWSVDGACEFNGAPATMHTIATHTSGTNRVVGRTPERLKSRREDDSTMFR
jgi:hypothetical protein